MRKISILLVLIFVLMAMSVSAQDEMMDLSFMGHSECETDLTGEVLTIYHIGDLSGPYAPITLPLLAGIEDAINFYNEEGILCGATLDQMYEDTGNDQSITQSAYDRFSTLDPKPTALILYSSDDSELLSNQLAEDEIPVLLAGGSVTGVFGEEASEPGWIFATNPLYVDQLGMFCDYVAANPEMFPDASIGYLSWEGAFGHSGDTEEVWDYCAEQGVAHAGSEFFLPTSQDIGNQAQNLVDNGATILYTNTLATGPVLVANTVNTLGLDVHVAGVNWVMDTSSVGLLGQAAFAADGLPITNGLLGSMPFTWWTETSHPGIQLITQLADKGERAITSRNVAYILGFASIDVIVEMYIQAANEGVAFADIDGAVVKSHLENMEFAPLGLTALDYRDGNRDAPMNRIGMMAYLGEDGMTPAGPDMAPMVVTLGDRNFLVPILIPLTDFEATPDLKPGGADVVGE
jgi:ABC-type branched-subunit amino acid transport system substrate-binding protein